jgi:hypothetical protein
MAGIPGMAGIPKCRTQAHIEGCQAQRTPNLVSGGTEHSLYVQRLAHTSRGLTDQPLSFSTASSLLQESSTLQGTSRLIAQHLTETCGSFRKGAWGNAVDK